MVAYLDPEHLELFKLIKQGEYATHFRRQLKARLLNDKIVTQIVRETTLAPSDFLKSNGRLGLALAVTPQLKAT